MRDPLLPGFKGPPKDVRQRATLRNKRKKVIAGIEAAKRLKRKQLEQRRRWVGGR